MGDPPSLWSACILSCCFDADVAEIVLDRCIVSDPNYKDPGDSNYTVLMNYEFLEDFKLPTEM